MVRWIPKMSNIAKKAKINKNKCHNSNSNNFLIPITSQPEVSNLNFIKLNMDKKFRVFDKTIDN